MKAIFRYPVGFVTLPEYTAHADQEVEIIRQLSEADGADVPTTPEEEQEIEKMFLVRAADDWEGYAFESELESV